MTARLWFWLHVMDALSAIGLFGSPAYTWAVGRASDATEWGEALTDDDLAASRGGKK